MTLDEISHAKWRIVDFGNACPLERIGPFWATKWQVAAPAPYDTPAYTPPEVEQCAVVVTLWLTVDEFYTKSKGGHELMAQVNLPNFAVLVVTALCANAPLLQTTTHDSCGSGLHLLSAGVGHHTAPHSTVARCYPQQVVCVPQ